MDLAPVVPVEPPEDRAVPTARWKDVAEEEPVDVSSTKAAKAAASTLRLTVGRFTEELPPAA